MATIRCQGITFENIQTILFDKDGTLAASEAFLRHLALRRARLIDAQVPGVQEPLLLAFGLDETTIDPAGLMAVGSRPENEIAAAAYVAETGRAWIPSLDLVRSAFVEADRLMQPKAAQTPPIDGVQAIVQRLADAGCTLGILSGDSTAHVQDFAQTYQLAAYFSVQLGSDGFISKLDPEFLKQALALLKATPATTILIGDSLADIQLAQSGAIAGCIGITGGWTRAVTLPGADALVRTFNQIEVFP